MTQTSPAIDLRDLLISDGVTTPIHIGSEPSAPDECITLYNYDGEAPSPKFLLDFPRLQVRARANSYTTAYSNILEVFDLLAGRASFTQNTTRYTGILPASNISDLGKDASGRFILVVSLKMFVEPAKVSQNRVSI